MSFPAQVLQQAQYDASVGGKNMPKNALQRAQGFLKSKLMPGAPTPNPSTMTPQQQAAFDAKQGGRLLKDFNKTRASSGPAGNLGGLKGGAVKGGLVTGLAAAAGSMVIPHIAREAVRGGLVVTGQDTTNYDNLNAGRPVVKNFGGVSYNIATPEGLRGALKAKGKGEKESFVTPPATPPATPPVTPSAATPTPSTDPRNAEYLAARAGLKTDSTDEDIKKVEDIGMTAWAKANPKLAAKVKPGQSGYEQIFADKSKEKVMDMMKTLNNPNIKPFVEGVNVPSTNFTANLTNAVPVDNYKGVMEDGAITELAKGLDLEAPQFNAQGFMNAFREDVINSPKAAESPGLGNTVDLPDVNNLISTLGEDEYFKRLDAGLLTRN